MKRWLPIVTCIFAALPCAAQRMAPVGVDLFGDDIVKPIESSGRGVVRVVKPPASEKVADPFGHVLFFADGRQLRGQLVELGKAEIVWQRADVEAPMRFPRKAIRRIELREGLPPTNSRGFVMARRQEAPADAKPASPMPATVKLPGCDWLHGDVRSEDGENFTLVLKNGAELKFIRSQVEWIYFDKKPVPAFGFSGELLSMEGWMRGNPATGTEVDDGLFRLLGTGWIGREMAPPPRFEVDFVLPQNEGSQPTRLWIQPYRPSPNSYSSGTIELSFGQKELGRLIYINQFKRETSAMPADNAEGTNRYRVFYDGIGDQLSVTRNGELLGQWSLVGDPPNEGRNRNPPKGICFDRGHGNQKLVLGALRVQPWDGVIPKKDAPDEERVVIGKEPARPGRLDRIGPDKFSVGGVESDRLEGSFVNFAQRPKGIADAGALLLFGHEGELAAADLEIRDGIAKARTNLTAALEVPADVLETIAFSASVPPEAFAGDTLVFRNGDTLRGKILKAGSGGSVRFEHDGQVSEFQPTNIAGVRLAREGAPKLAAGAALELCNGDRFRGEVVALESEAVRFRHADFGEKAFPRGKLRRLYPAASSLVLDAASDPEAWLGLRPPKANLFAIAQRSTAPATERVFLDGVFLQAQPMTSSWSVSGLAYQLEKAPERYEFRCEVTDAGGAEPYINLTIAGSNGTPSLQVSLGSGQLRFYAYNMQRARAGGAMFQQNREVPLEGKFTEQFSRREVRLFVDTKLGTVDIVADGVHLAKFGQQPAERAPGIGAQITLSGYGYSSAVTVVSNVCITPWNGDLPQVGETNGSISLVNGDFTEGPVGEIKDGKLTAGVANDTLEIPLDRILCVDFGGAAVAEKPAARVRFQDGAVVHFSAFEFDRESLSGESVTLGPVKVPTSSIAEVILSPAPIRFPKIAPPKKLVSKEAEPAAEVPAP